MRIIICLLLFLPSQCWAAFGDILNFGVNNSGGSTNCTATLGGSPTAGSLIVAVCFAGDDADVVPQGDLLEAIENPDVVQTDTTALGYRYVQSGDGTTWGFTQGSSDQIAAIVREFDGGFETTPLDQTGITAYATNDTTIIATVDGATSQNDELAVAGWGYRTLAGQAQTITFDSVSDSFTNLLEEVDQDGTGAEKAVGTAIKVLSTIHTPSTTGTFSASNSVVFSAGALMATFKASGGAPAPAPIKRRPMGVFR